VHHTRGCTLPSPLQETVLQGVLLGGLGELNGGSTRSCVQVGERQAGRCSGGVDPAIDAYVIGSLQPNQRGIEGTGHGHARLGRVYVHPGVAGSATAGQ